MIDDFLPPSVVRLARLKAVESRHWQPMAEGYKSSWAGLKSFNDHGSFQPVQKIESARTSDPLERRWLFTPSVATDGFPGESELRVGALGRSLRGTSVLLTLLPRVAGIGTLLSHSYEELLWARLHQLSLDTSLGAVLTEQLRFDWVSQAFLGLVCLNPEKLHPGQRVPHVDRADVGGGEPQLAMLHYLTEWRAAPEASAARGPADGRNGAPGGEWGEERAHAHAEAGAATSRGATSRGAASGGTAFYRERHSGASNFLPSSCAALTSGGGSFFCRGSLVHRCVKQEASEQECAALPEGLLSRWSQRSQGQGYMAGSDGDFELLHVVPHAFNRAAIYSAKQLHNGHITQAAVRALTCEPAAARLTANVFFR